MSEPPEKPILDYINSKTVFLEHKLQFGLKETIILSKD